VPVPAITETGDLPQGLYRASLEEILTRFGEASVQRKLVGMRLRRVYELAVTTRHVKRFIVFGSFVTSKPEPNDVDVFLVMDDAFDLSQVKGEAALVFDHPAAQAHFGASIFWLRCQVKRRQSKAGSANETERGGVSWRSRRSSHDRE
jgi:hypothetical protein